MPRYDYYCPANGRIVEVRHSIHDRMEYWEEVCIATNMAPGNTPLDAEVVRLFAASENLVADKSLPPGSDTTHTYSCVCCSPFTAAINRALSLDKN